MKPGKPQLVDFSKSEGMAQALPHAPVLSSQTAGWAGLSLSYFSYPEAREVPELVVTHHVLGIADVDTPVAVECRLNGQLQRSRIQNGICMLTPAQTHYWANWESGGKFLLLNLETRFVSQLACETINSDRVELVPQFAVADPLVQQIGLALKADLESGSSWGALYAETLGTALVVHLLKNYGTCRPQFSNAPKELGRDRLQGAIAYIDAYLEQRLTLQEIAQVAGMSQYYFSRLFKQSTGTTVHQYVTQQRIDRAKQLLKLRHLPLAEIAIRCGFADQSHFTKSFHKLVGVSPKVYREEI
jgi:AraC family transcriptional regulator